MWCRSPWDCDAIVPRELTRISEKWWLDQNIDRHQFWIRLRSRSQFSWDYSMSHIIRLLWSPRPKSPIKQKFDRLLRKISCQKKSSRVIYRVWYPHLPIIIFIYLIPPKGKGLSVRMPPNHYIQQKARNAVTHAHYSATHPFSTGTNTEKNQIASSQELPPAPRSMHQSVHDYPEKTQLGAAESGSGTADIWFWSDSLHPRYRSQLARTLSSNDPRRSGKRFTRS